MPEGLAEFFIKAASPTDGVVIDPFAGSATTVVIARRLGRKSGGIEIHEKFAIEAKRRIAADTATDTQGRLFDAAAG
jgi:DNA modification methylase